MADNETAPSGGPDGARPAARPGGEPPATRATSEDPPAGRATDEPREVEAPGPTGGSPAVAAVAAWLLPGAGHLYLRRWGRGILFFAVVMTSVAIGVVLEGKLWEVIPGQPLSILGTLGCAGLGVPFFVLRFLLDYQGEVVAAGFEYGGAFILTGGLMNLLLVLDAWDLARGVKR